MSCGDRVEVNGKVYIAEKPSLGTRAVLVVDRGWIFAGDVTRVDGRIKLTRAVWVFRWESIGFDGVLRDPKSSKVSIRRLDHDVDVPADAEVFCIPVADNNWGL